MKIGIIGSESTHANAFAEILRKMNIETVIDDNLSASFDLDGVMIVSRDGNAHKTQALPFIEAKIPVWIDKPLAVDYKDAEEIINAAKLHNTLITGGSMVKFSSELITLEKRIKIGGFGEITATNLGFPIILDSPYNGFHFYGHHLIELMLMLFGHDIKSVRAFEKNGGVVCMARYNNIDVVLNFFRLVTWDGYGVIWGSEACELQKFDLSNAYEDGVRVFVNMIETREEPMPHDRLMFPIKIAHAIEKSYIEDKEVELWGNKG